MVLAVTIGKPIDSHSAHSLVASLLQVNQAVEMLHQPGMRHVTRMFR